MSLQGRPVVVLGMFRSGTSSVSASLAKLGFFFGEDQDFFPTDEFNQTGYWELRDVMAVNRRCLAALGMSYHKVNPIPSDWKQLPGIPKALDQIQEVLLKHFDGKERWGFKEPMTSAILPLYREVFDRNKIVPHYAICVRNPLDVGASERSREPLMGDQSYGLWLHYTLAPLVETIGQSRSLIVYEQFVLDPPVALGDIAREVGVDGTEDEWMDADEMIQPNLRHNRSDIDSLNAWPSLLRRTYELCLKAGKDRVGFAAGAYDDAIRGLWKELCQLKAMLKQSDLENGTITLSWKDGDKVATRASRFVPTGAWQNFRAEVTSEPGSIVRADLYQAPCQIWIRRAAWKSSKGLLAAEMQAGATGFLEEREGMPLLSIFGPDPLLLRTPDEAGPHELEIEFLLESDFHVATRILTRLRDQGKPT